MATIVNTRDAKLQASSPRTLSVSLGANIIVPSGNVTGLDSLYDATRQVQLVASSLIFQVPKSGATMPTTLTMTANLKNITGTPVFSTIAGTCSFTTNGNILTILPSGLTTSTATIQVAVTFDSVTYYDKVTIAKVAEGTDAVTTLLSNEACVVTTPFDGTTTPTTFNNAGGTLYVFDGIVNMTGNAAVTYSVLNQVGLTMAITTAGVYSVSAMSADFGSATIRAVYKGLTIDKTYSIAKAKSGADSRIVSVTADSQVFQVAKNGTASPTSVNLTAASANLTGLPSFSILSGTATLTGTGSSRIIAYSSMTTDSVTVRVTWDGKTDDITIVKLREGVDSIIGYLTNESALIPADNAGTLTQSLTTVSGTFKVYQGVTDKTGTSVTYSVYASSNVTAAISTAGVYTISAITADAGTVTFRAVFGGVTIDKIFSLAKVKAGVVGTDGVRGNVQLSRAITGSVWSDSEAVTAISSQGFGVPRDRDIVTLYNTSTGYTGTKFYDGAAWLTLDAYVNGNMLVQGTVGAGALAAGSVSTQHLAVSNGKNILNNSAPVINSVKGWARNAWNTSTPSEPWFDAYWCPSGASAVAMNVPGAQAAGTVFDLWNSNFDKRYPVKGGQRYEVSAYLSMHRASGAVYLFWYDAAGNYISELTAGSSVTTSHASSTSIKDFGRSVGFVTAPSNAATVKFCIRAVCYAASDPHIFCSMAYMGEALPNQTVYTPWSEGGVTTVGATGISTTNLSAISSDLGAVTAGSLNINGRFIVSTSGLCTITSAGTGQRTEFDSNGLRVYDTAGTLRVRVGMW